MSLSVVVHGIPVKSGANLCGRLAAADITTTDGTEHIVYNVPTSSDVEWDYLIFSISICNRATATATGVAVAIATADTALDEEWIETSASIVPSGVLERTQLIANPGDRIVVRVG